MPNLLVAIKSDDTLRWLARIRELAKPYLDLSDLVAFDNAVGTLMHVSVDDFVLQIRMLLHRAMARAESKCVGSSAPTGAVVQIGEAFKTFSEITSVIKGAKQEVFIVDPYMNETALTDFAIVASESVKIRLLTADTPQTLALQQSLQAASFRWIAEYGTKRPLETKKAAGRSLHDRVVFIDQTATWILSQSIKDFAVRSPATVIPVDTSLVADKLAAYEAMWTSATRL